MKCPSCKYVTADEKDICPKCQLDLRPHKKTLGLPISEPNKTSLELRKEELTRQKKLQKKKKAKPKKPQKVKKEAKPKQSQEKKSSWLDSVFAKKKDAATQEENSPGTTQKANGSQTPTLEKAPPPSGEASKGLGAEVLDSALDSLLAQFDTAESIEEKQEVPREAEEQFEDKEELLQAQSSIDEVRSLGVAPEVMEFGEDEEELEQQLDQLIGGLTFDVEAVKEKQKPVIKPPESSNLFVEDCDIEISFEIDVDGEEEEPEPKDSVNEQTELAAPVADLEAETLAAAEQSADHVEQGGEVEGEEDEENLGLFEGLLDIEEKLVRDEAEEHLAEEEDEDEEDEAPLFDLSGGEEVKVADSAEEDEEEEGLFPFEIENAVAEISVEEASRHIEAALSEDKGDSTPEPEETEILSTEGEISSSPDTDWRKILQTSSQKTAEQVPDLSEFESELERELELLSRSKIAEPLESSPKKKSPRMRISG